MLKITVIEIVNIDSLDGSDYGGVGLWRRLNFTWCVMGRLNGMP